MSVCLQMVCTICNNAFSRSCQGALHIRRNGSQLQERLTRHSGCAASILHHKRFIECARRQTAYLTVVAAVLLLSLLVTAGPAACRCCVSWFRQRHTTLTTKWHQRRCTGSAYCATRTLRSCSQHTSPAKRHSKQLGSNMWTLPSKPWGNCCCSIWTAAMPLQ